MQKPGHALDDQEVRARKLQQRCQDSRGLDMTHTKLVRSARPWLVAVLAGFMAPLSVSAAEPPAVKWHPGHYMLVYLGENPAQRLHRFDQIAGENALQGAQVRYRWAELEPRKGEYDFSAIEKDLQKLQSNRQRLVIQVMDRAFNAKTPEGIVPAYLMTEREYNGGVAATTTGYVARLWDPAVMDREIALFRALGARFDGEPYVEGIAGGETAPALGKNRPDGFSNDALAAQLARWIDATRAAWPRTNLFLYANFLGGKLPGLIAKCADGACGVGGPDVLPPPDDGTEGDRVLMGKMGGVDYRGRMPVAYAVQTPALGGRKGNFTPEQLFDYAYSTLHANYIFWIRNTGTGGPGQKWDTGILPFIRSIDGKIRTECPRSLQARCTTDERQPHRGVLREGRE
jgi:hypothetical protein